MAQWANDKTQPWTELKFNQFGFGKRPDQMFYCTKPDWSARQILTAYS